MANKVSQAPPPGSEVGTRGFYKRPDPDAERIKAPTRLIEFYPNSLKERTRHVLSEAIETFRRPQIMDCCTSVVGRLAPLFYAEIQAGRLRLDLARPSMGFIVDEFIRLNCDKYGDQGLRCKQKLESSKQWRGFSSRLAKLEAKQANRSSVGLNIDRLRTECGWSLDHLAEKTGLDKKLVLSHVNKPTSPQPRTMKLYAQAFTKELVRPITIEDLKK